jgi:hypothetical protein
MLCRKLICVNSVEKQLFLVRSENDLFYYPRTAARNCNLNRWNRFSGSMMLSAFFSVLILVIVGCNGLYTLQNAVVTGNSSFSLDGCRYVFLDLGSNIGIHVRFLYEPYLYSRQPYSSHVFDLHFPVLRNRTDVCAVGFEPNIRHEARLNNLHRYYGQWGLRAYWIISAVSDYMGTTEFAHQGDVNENEFGFQKHGIGIHEKRDVGAPDMITVQVTNITEFILTTVRGRKIPEKLLESDPVPAVIVKMDVEAEEKVILPALFRTDAICEIKEITMEWHFKKHQPFDHFLFGDKDFMDLLPRQQNNTNCRFNIVEFDTEAHLHDLPESHIAIKKINEAQQPPAEKEKLMWTSYKKQWHPLRLSD